MILEPQTLQGRFVRLEPYVAELRDEVREALDCDPEGWSLTASHGRGEAFEGWWALKTKAMADGQEVPFAIRRLSDGRVVGSSSWMTIRCEHRGLEIGSTFLRPEARSGVVNPEAKLLMLQGAFDAGAVRVELVTDLRNQRSAAAIAKLGAVREGVLRRHKVTWTGHLRDTVVFSITDDEWPAVRAGLVARLEQVAEAGVV